MAPLENLSLEALDGVVVAHLRGEVDLSNAASVKEQLLEAVRRFAR